MPSLIDLRRRIRAVKNTQQITKAMKMVAASKLRRAQDRILSARPYAVQMRHVLRSVAARVDPAVHPLLARPGTDAAGALGDAATAPIAGPAEAARPGTLAIVVTGDKGLCGSFNTNVIKAAGAFILESPQPCQLGLVGRKGRDFFIRRGFQVAFERVGIFQQLKFEDARGIADTAIEQFLSGAVDRVVLIYNEFKSIMTQRVVVDQLLPILPEAISASSEHPAEGAGLSPTAAAVPGDALVEYLYQPSAEEIFKALLPRYVEVEVLRSLLESNAAFFAAQMTAMDTATKNSADMIGSLTLYMNKVRQAAITREIIEVVSGAEAL
jgi:F-type H+-transporting ATPase subunit gamma